MNTNKTATDPFEKIIFEEGIRIHNVFPDFDYKIMVVLLNTGNAFQFSFKNLDKLNNASRQDLSNFRLIGGGVGIHWNTLDEDLSLKGIIKDAVQAEALQRLQSKNNDSELSFV